MKRTIQKTVGERNSVTPGFSAQIRSITTLIRILQIRILQTDSVNSHYLVPFCILYSRPSGAGLSLPSRLAVIEVNRGSTKNWETTRLHEATFLAYMCDKHFSPGES